MTKAEIFSAARAKLVAGGWLLLISEPRLHAALELLRHWPQYRWRRTIIGPLAALMHESGWWVYWRSTRIARGSWPKYKTT